MRINHTGRRKIDKQHALVVLRDDPVGSKRGWYFDLQLDLSSYALPPAALLFVEASRKLVLMRFDLGTVAAPLSLTPLQRRLSDFLPAPEGVTFRVKVTQPDGPDRGKLLAEADNLKPDLDHTGVHALITFEGADDLGQTPWELGLVPTESALPVLRINQALGGKEYARNPEAKPLLMFAAAREVFATLLDPATDIPDGADQDESHWAYLWSRYATEVLGRPHPTDIGNRPEDREKWIADAASAFAEHQKLVDAVVSHRHLQALQTDAGQEYAQ